jgi:hypothetical protein
MTYEVHAVHEHPSKAVNQFKKDIEKLDYIMFLYSRVIS